MNDSVIHALRQRRHRLTALTTPGRDGAARNPDHRLTRRRFMQATGGSLVAGATLGAQLLRPSALYAAGDDPLPVPENPFFSPFRIYAPAPAGFGLDPIDAEPSTITNFNGVVGLAYIDGMVTRTTISTGDSIDLPFLFSDMRFMSGVYRGVDGKPRQGTFALI